MVKIIVTGLKPEEHMFKQSLEEMCLATAEKLETQINFAPEDELHLQIKSHVEGKKKRFEVKARITVQGHVYEAKEQDRDEHQHVWDLRLGVKEALEELKKVVKKRAKFRPIKGLTADEAMEKKVKEMPE